MQEQKAKKSKTILAVDDERQIRSMLSQYLTQQGFRVELASNGRDASRCLKRINPDLIILDVVMPLMDGFKFLQYLKSSVKYSRIPVIMLTDKSEPKNVEKGISFAADFYLPKPCTLDNLLNFIRLSLE